MNTMGYEIFDELTGLYNRRGFFEKAEEMIKSHEPGYYVMTCFDIENFKVVNDQYGTPHGDAILRHIADTFKKGFEPEGGICCRISSDDFALLFPRSFMDSKEHTEIREKSSVFEGTIMPLNFSIGRYIVDDLSLSVSAMYDRASLAERVAKGRYDANIIVYDESMREKLLREQRIVTQMKSALASGQFEVWFQPQYNHCSGALIGSEALVRWWQPASGQMISPGEFIPIFERNGFIYEVDKYVWEQCCFLLRKWIDEGRNPLPVSVNISRYDIFHPEFYDTITGMLKRYNLTPSLLRLEITETAFANAPEQIIAMVKRLIAFGFTVEIDDFGSGYSSLNTLKDVPAQILKLDMKFLQKAEDSEKSGIILESIVRMAKWLGMAVIAEGVETTEQANHLKSIGCHYVQGYLYARPMPASDYEAFAGRHSKESEMIALETVNNLDNNQFWDAHSIDTLIFSSYVGSACVVEYNMGRTELLRVNDRFISEVGITFESGNPLGVLDLYQYMDESSKQSMREHITRAVQTGEEVEDEFILLPSEGHLKSKQHLRCVFRAIARVGERVLLYCIVDNVTEQRLAEQKEREAMAELSQMMQDMPGGYAKMKITPEGIIPVFLNDEFCRLFGMTNEETMDFYAGNAYTGVHPDDLEDVHKLMNKAIEKRTTISMRLRLASAHGGYVPVQAFYRVTEGPDCLYLNGYYTDAKKQVQEEERQRELLDNLPYGAGLFRYDSQQLSVSHLNKRYWELVNRPAVEYKRISFITLVHPNDRKLIFRLLAEAAKHEHDIVCDLRILHGQDGDYIPFHIVGKLVKSKNGGHNIYAVFTPISQDSMSYQEMLPIALSAIMESTNELSFIKDKHLRYVCASRAFANMVGIDDIDTIIGKTDYDLFDEKLANNYRRDDEALFRNKRPIVDFVENIPSSGEGNRYSLTSKYLLYDAAGNIIGLYGTGRDITRQRRIRELQLEATDQLHFLNETAHHLLDQPDIESGINNTLNKLREYFDGSRAYIFEFDYNRSHATNTYEVCAKGVSAQMENLQKLPLSIMKFWLKAFKEQKWFAINDLSELDDSRAEEREILLSQGVTSLYTVPLYLNGEIVGMFGVDDPKRQMLHLDLLLALGDYISVMLTRRDYARHLSEERRIMEQMMQDMPGGYVKMRITATSIETLFMNNEFCRILGMTHDEAMTLYAKDAFAGVHPDDMHLSISALSKAIAERDTVSLRLRFADKRGVYIPIQAFYRVTEDTSGLYLNGYYTDAAKIIQLEEQRQELLENFPCAAGMFEITDDDIRAIYHNKHFRSYFKYDIVELTDSSMLNIVHPDDLDDLTSELRKAMNDAGECSCDIRIEDGNGGYLPFHVTGREMERRHDKVTMFVSYIPITERELLIQERAEMDGMTGVYNKSTAEAIISARLSSSKGVHCAVMIVDVDDLKKINDTMGHPQGDRAICLIAEALKAQFRKTDIIGRIGGDEFIIYLEGVSREEKLQSLALGLLQRLSAMRIGENDDYSIHASIGIAKSFTGDAFFKTLYLQADKALYEAKNRGKNQFAFFVGDK